MQTFDESEIKEHFTPGAKVWKNKLFLEKKSHEKLWFTKCVQQMDYP